MHPVSVHKQDELADPFCYRNELIANESIGRPALQRGIEKAGTKGQIGFPFGPVNARIEEGRASSRMSNPNRIIEYSLQPLPHVAAQHFHLRIPLQEHQGPDDVAYPGQMVLRALLNLRAVLVKVTFDPFAKPVYANPEPLLGLFQLGQHDSGADDPARDG